MIKLFGWEPKKVSFIFSDLLKSGISWLSSDVCVRVKKLHGLKPTVFFQLVDAVMEKLDPEGKRL